MGLGALGAVLMKHHLHLKEASVLVSNFSLEKNKKEVLLPNGLKTSFLSYFLKLFLRPSTAPSMPSLTSSRPSFAFATTFSTAPSISVFLSAVSLPAPSLRAP